MPKPQARLADLSDAQIRGRIEAALSGDREVMDALVQDLTPIIHVRVARALMRRRQQARGRDLRHDLEDLVQEVFAALFAKQGQALRRWDPDRGLSFTGFVGFLAEREVGMMMRTGKRNPWTEDPTADEFLVTLTGAEGDHAARLESREMLVRVAERLRERLSPRGRQYFQLMYIENRPVQDIAERTGTTPGALYAWRSRVLKLLRDLKNELEAEEGRHVG